jgi:hypothetical protein
MATLLFSNSLAVLFLLWPSAPLLCSHTVIMFGYWNSIFKYTFISLLSCHAIFDLLLEDQYRTLSLIS